MKRSLILTRLAMLVVLFVCSSIAAAQPLIIENVRVAKSGHVTRVVFDTNAIPQYKIFTLNNPSRVVIDFRRGNFSKKIDQNLFSSSFVKRLRHAQRGNDTLRVVLDLNQNIIPKSFILPPHEGANHRFVIDLKGAKVKKAVAKSTPKKATKTTSKPATNKVVASKPKKEPNKKDIIAKITTPPAVKNKPAPSKSKKATPTNLREVVVAIDPGHGGKDPGATGYSGTREKDVVLQISKRLARLINAQHGMRAVLTRESDKFLTLRGRIKKAKTQKADVFISIHADAIKDRRVRGSSVYVLSKNGASSEAAEILARGQNASDTIGGVSLKGKDKVLQKVIVDLSQTATIDASMDLAIQVKKELSLLGKTRKRVEHAGFRVLKLPDIPSILVETAFISNATEEKRLRSPEHQQKLATAIFRGVTNYINQHPPNDAIIANRVPREKHIIRRGETLSGIAQRYRVSLDALRSVNALRTDTIRVGQKLIIPEV